MNSRRYARRNAARRIGNFHSRSAQPTRRVALGHLVLPVEPAPGLGGILLGAVVARHALDLASDDILVFVGSSAISVPVAEWYSPECGIATKSIAMGLRSASSPHREGEEMSFEFADRGGDLAQVLGAIYAIERLDQQHRSSIADVLIQALRWKGPIGPSMVAFLAGAQSSSLAALADPRAWALERLGFSDVETSPSSRKSPAVTGSKCDRCTQIMEETMRMQAQRYVNLPRLVVS